MTLKQAISQRIEECCEKNGLNASSLAYICGMDRSTVYSILGSKSKSPEIVSIKKICDGLNMTLCEFFDTPYFNTLEQEIK